VAAGKRSLDLLCVPLLARWRGVSRLIDWSTHRLYCLYLHAVRGASVIRPPSAGEGRGMNEVIDGSLSR